MSELPDWAQKAENAPDPDWNPTWTNQPKPDLAAVPEPPQTSGESPQTATPAPHEVTGAPTGPAGPVAPPAGWVGPQPNQVLDELEVAASKLGFLLVAEGQQVDREAARLVGAEIEAKGVGFNGHGHLVVAWPDLPSPSDVKEVVEATGHAIYPAVAGKTAYKSLEWQIAEILANDDYQVTLDPMVQYVLDQNASDLHLSTGERPWVRLGSTFAAIPRYPRLSADDTLRLAREIAGEDFALETFDGDLDMSITFGSTRFRVNLYLERGQLAMALRTIPVTIPRFETLGLPRAALKFTGLREGLVVVAGPTGSGKSTSLASLLDIVNDDREEHIVTLEAPIEYVHSSKRSMVHQREIGQDTESFKRALKSVLRQDPDIILVGEMRDYEEISLAITAAETGHLVFATVHAHNTGGVIDRIIDVFPSEQQNQVRAQLANTLRGVLAQKLLPDAENSQRRHLAYEIAFVNDPIRSIIANPDQSNAKITESIASGRAEGMMSFDGSLAMLTVEGKISRDEAARNTIDSEVFSAYFDGFQRSQNQPGASGGR